MIQTIQNLLENYSTWLQDRTSFRELDDSIEITTPYLDRHNDYIQIYIEFSEDEILLTDGGYVLEDLEMSGYKIDGPKRQTMLNITLNGFDVQLNGKTLEARASSSDFSLKLHNLVQTMLAVNDLYYLASPSVVPMFVENTDGWLNHHNITHSCKIKYPGKSGFEHEFDFVIPQTRTHPERVLKAINRPDRGTAQRMVFSWLDIKDAVSSGTCAYAILNDSDQEVQGSVMDALHNYDVRTILWSNRNQAYAELAA